MQDPKPSWGSLFGFTLRAHLPTLIPGAVFALLAGCVTPALAILLGNLFDAFTNFGAGRITGDELRTRVESNCLGVFGLGAAGWLLNGAYFAAFVVFGALQACFIRKRLFAELLKRDVEWFEAQDEGVGAFLSGVQAHVHDLQMATSQPLAFLIQYLCRSLAALCLGFYTSWSLSLVTLAGIPMFSAAIAVLSSRLNQSITFQQEELTHASKVANNAIASIDTVQCLNGQDFESRKYAARIDKAALYYLRQARLSSVQISLICWMMFGMFVQGFWFGSILARQGKLTSGEVLRTFWACLTAAQSIEQLLPQIIVMEKGKVASVALQSILRTRPDNRRASEMKGALYPQYCEGDIKVNNVSFSYPAQPDTCVLKPSTFFFPAGETTFVIGKSGSGKSTLGQLLMRFYLPTSGQISVDGNPLQSLHVSWIRNNLTLVEQRSVLFSDSVYRNITFGHHKENEVTDKEIHQAIKLAALQETIEFLPSGLDTCVGPGGGFLSGGQKQRIAIARARLRDTPILILDEPTSALDYENRSEVMRAIREWRRGRTTIIITHDMSHILDDDFVYVLEHGTIVQSGHRSALEKCASSEKYFGLASRTDRSAAKLSSPSANTELSDYEGSSSINSINERRPGLPARVYHRGRASWAQHHIPPGLRSRSLEVTGKRRLLTSAITEETSLSSKAGLFQAEQTDYAQTVTGEFEMTELGNGADNLRRFPGSDHSRPSQIPQEHPAKNGDLIPLSCIMRTVLPTLSPKKRVILLLGFLAALGHASATPIFAFCLSQLFKTFYAGRNSAQLTKKWALAVLGVSIGDGLSSFFMHYLLELCGEAWMDALRKSAFHRVLNQPRFWFEKKENSASRLASYLDQNSEDMRNLVGRFAGFVIVAASIAVMAVIWSLVVCWKLTLVALACGPIIYIITRSFEGSNGQWERRCNEADTVAAEIFSETFSEIRTVRALTLEGYFHRKQGNAISHCLSLGLKRAIYTGMLFGLVESAVIFTSALMFYYASKLAIAEFTVNDVMTVISLLLFSMGYAAQVLSWIPQVNTSREIASQLLRLSRLPEAGSHEHRGQLKNSRLTPIQLMNLDFRYPSRPNMPILKNVSITISQNSCTAIVGQSGSGKSTIALLLLSLYETPVSRNGRPTITLGGQDISLLHVPTLRSRIAIVSQQPTIFPGSIQTNISYGIDEHSPLASFYHVQAAAQAAGVDDFISSLPRGYATVIGDGGVGLSGGQKQRIVLARALLRRPQILILDEATSSLDPAGAEIVRQTIQRLVSERRDLTVIMITHSQEMIGIADHVVVLDQGVVVGDGSYTASPRREGRL
ncbi:hypothetical protein N7492_005602 [Penicillium capsulatum]|uniref:ABC a-pheromone efflux pump AtrD n=1 Tax=Penicillium capsulatum TaxID=69766 RepID=A0A9W9I9P9_9EURO|nr:hypothetical protein N7492_005602 [Penicillium capsulatum]